MEEEREMNSSMMKEREFSITIHHAGVFKPEGRYDSDLDKA